MATNPPAPFAAPEWAELKRLAKAIKQWNEAECDGAIQWEGENEDIPRLYFQDGQGCYDRPGPVIKNKEKQFLKRAEKIAAKHEMLIYHCSDPRSSTLYVYSQAELDGRIIDDCYPTISKPVC